MTYRAYRVRVEGVEVAMFHDATMAQAHASHVGGIVEDVSEVERIVFEACGLSGNVYLRPDGQWDAHLHMMGSYGVCGLGSTADEAIADCRRAFQDVRAWFAALPAEQPAPVAAQAVRL